MLTQNIHIYAKNQTKTDAYVQKIKITYRFSYLLLHFLLEHPSFTFPSNNKQTYTKTNTKKREK